MQSVKAKSPGSKKKATSAPNSAGPGAMSAGSVLGSLDEPNSPDDQSKEVESYTASGLDNALDLLEVVTAKMDKASVGAQASKIEQHPEVSIRLYCRIDLDLIFISSNSVVSR